MISKNVNLKCYNTFGINVTAKQFSSFKTIDELKELMKNKSDTNLLVLGGGSNILFTRDFEGLVIKNEIKGFSIVFENDEYVHIKSGAGEIWHEFVLHCIANNYGGIENLSLIPGNVGASPMQNIGAYGTEIKDVFVDLEAYHIDSGEIHTFTKKQCAFGYRESVFKRKLKDQYIILSVTYQLSKKHKINSSYGAIEAELTAKGIASPTIKNISDAVIAIRSSKLPDPRKIGNAGSFFKNPVVSAELVEKIQQKYEDVPNYPVSKTEIKLAAGWLIEKAGWKGKMFDTYGVHKNQALVLVNFGAATGKEILHLSQLIIEDVEQKFGVRLEREVNIV